MLFFLKNQIREESRFYNSTHAVSFKPRERRQRSDKYFVDDGYTDQNRRDDYHRRNRRCRRH